MLVIVTHGVPYSQARPKLVVLCCSIKCEPPTIAQQTEAALHKAASEKFCSLVYQMIQVSDQVVPSLLPQSK